MAGSTEAWDEVGERFAALGRIYAERYRKRGEELGPTTEEDRRALEDAARTVTRHLDQAFTSLGETIRDREAKESLKEAAKALGDALSVTFDEVGDEIRKRVRKEP